MLLCAPAEDRFFSGRSDNRLPILTIPNNRINEYLKLFAMNRHFIHQMRSVSSIHSFTYLSIYKLSFTYTVLNESQPIANNTRKAESYKSVEYLQREW
jgi:hypothetical protein